MSGYFSKTSGVVVSKPEFDRTELITNDTYPVYNYAGGYVGYVSNGEVILVKEPLVDPIYEDYGME